MASHKTYTVKTRTNAGITLIEIIIVIGLITIMSGFAVLVGQESYRGYTFRSTRDLLVSTLLRARAQSINNVCLGSLCTDGKPHGVRILTDASGHMTTLVIFQGGTYAATDTLNSSIAIGSNISGAIFLNGLQEISFEQLSGNANATGTITLSDTAQSSTITIGSEGQIFWTN